MYIVAIAWLYVVLMMSITERTAIAGVMTFLLYGVFPLTIVLYLMGTPQRKRNRQAAQKLKALNAHPQAAGAGVNSAMAATAASHAAADVPGPTLAAPQHISQATTVAADTALQQDSPKPDQANAWRKTDEG